jgi:K+-transporting ATPase KdpF subunit
VRGAGSSAVSWAYGLSAVLAIALVVYLVVALIRAEDL